VRRLNQTEFWTNTKPVFRLPILNDSGITYDTLAQRWYAFAQAQRGPTYGFLAVSVSADRNQGRRGVQLPMAPANLGMNYNTTCVDPSDPTLFWTYPEYAASNDPSQYTTCWVAFKLE
jgi:hypothetical protein